MIFTNLTNEFYYPDKKYSDLEELVVFPGTEIKRGHIPNSTVWVFNKNHKYNSDILYDDVGCGMAAFAIKPVDISESIEKITEYLKNKNILGRGNHFIDLCDNLEPIDKYDSKYQFLIIHSDGKSFDKTIPQNIEEAIIKQKNAETFREELGFNLSNIINTKYELIGNWTHNSVEETKSNIIYRKGTIKTEADKIHILPSKLDEPIIFYKISKDNLPPYNSMPHATGRKVSRSEGKVNVIDAKELRNIVYISKEISDTSLRTEHPSCYKNFDEINNSILCEKIIPSGKLKIVGYVGKI